ncbi:LOW QUALITY PROTEIN: uncharacterized protein LOC134219787 [Armigeres subalbatus]|uniref:LOW QUALITY PROTEIN: uncharacterized protein LOC134219787 n=1 Tax=Armigeres subalbatus TaxID=124917 RepID=UPI002ED345AF
MIDDRLNFNSHVDYACEKATKAITALTRIMSNSSAISSSKRRLLASVSTSILRYGAPVWAAGEITRRNLTRLNSTYRLMAMRVASAYRTISMDAVCAIVGMTPINILLEEDCECYRLRGTVGARMIARADSMRKWQLAWDSSSKGRWTYRLIPNLSLWVDRKHGEIKLLVTSIKSAVKAAEHEQIALKKKAEAAEKVLKDAAEHTAVETQQAPKSPRITRTEKRGRDSPGEQEGTKKQRNVQDFASVRKERVKDETRQSEIEALKAEIEQQGIDDIGNSSKFTIPDPIKNLSEFSGKFHANEVDVDNDDDDDEDDNVQETYEKLDKTFNSLLDNELNLEKVTFDSLDSLNFIFKIDELLYYLEIIEESITLAGQSIPSSRIIHPEELSVIRHTLNDNGFRLNSVDDMLNIASAYAVYNNEMFMYILKIPKIKDVQYKIGLIEPVIANNLRIHLTAQFYIEGKNVFMKKKNPCPKMKDLSICSSSNLEPPTECIQQLVSGQHTAKCPMERIYEAKTIRKITEGNIMVTGSNITLSSNCSSERLLNGSFLIQYSNCTVKLDDEEYANSDMEIQPFIPTTGIKVSPTILINNIPLQYLQEMHLEHRNQIDHLNLTTNNLHWKLHMFGWLTSLSTTVIIICILGLYIAIIFKIFSWRKHLTLNTKEDIHINFSLATDGCPESRDIPLIPQQ